MTMFARLLTTLTLGLVALSAASASDIWSLDKDASSLSFASVKNESNGEVHHFTGLSGTVSLKTGVATVEIDVQTVETGIDIRNQRMLTHLFKSATNQAASVSVPLPADIETLKSGETRLIEVEADIQIIGTSAVIDALLLVARLDDKTLLVTPASQILLNSEDWGLDQGIGKLKSIAGLDSIDLVVPISFRFVWTRD